MRIKLDKKLNEIKYLGIKWKKNQEENKKQQ
jgi:hypothetical protein